MNKNKKFKGYWYLYIHAKLKDRSINNTLSLKETKAFLFEWRIPKWLRVVVIKEMEELDLIEMEDKYNIRFNDSHVDIEDVSRIFNDIGLLCYDDE